MLFLWGMRNLLILLLLVGVLFAKRSVAQDASGLGSWNILNLKYGISKKWSLFGEAQLRSLRFYDHFHYYEYKGGVNYQPIPQLRLTLGLGDYDTYAEGGNFLTPKNNDELRIWPQINFTHKVGAFVLEQRYRAEFRFTQQGYRNRYRYRLGVSYPFGNKKAGYHPFQVSAGNELFFTNREPYFERNRINLAFSYRYSTAVTFQAGYLHQFDYRINDETGRDFLQLGVYFELSGNSSKQKPGNIEMKDN